MAAEQKLDDTATDKRDGETPWLEYVAAGLGVAFALGVLGVISWEAVAGADTPPDIAVKTLQTTPASGGYAVEISALNTGTKTASEVEIEGQVGDETGNTTFDFVPGGAERKGTLVFKIDPGPAGPQLRVLGYREP
jgi:uncharacterized protein (TIGR02588 family)